MGSQYIWWKRIIFLILIIVLVTAFFYSPWFQRKLYPLQYKEAINQSSKEFGVDPYMVAAIIYVESRFQGNVASHKGAVGLMQIMPGTGKWIAERLKIRDFNNQMLLTPAVNIRIGCWYLNNLDKQFGGNTDLILAAYNGGSGNVNRWLSSKEHSLDGKNLDYIPFKETREYVTKVKKAYKKYVRLYDFR